MSDSEITIRISAKNLTKEEFDKARQEVTGLTDKYKASMKESTGVTDQHTTSFGKLVASYASGQAVWDLTKRGVREIVAFTKESIAAYAEQQAAVNKLNAALKAQGTYTPELSKQQQDLAGHFQNTTVYADELITEMMALLVQVGNVAPRDMKAALTAATDLAAGLGIDLKSATMMVAKAAEGNTQTLGRYGIALDKTRIEAEGLSYISEALSKKFGGQAAAQLDTYAGKTAQLGNLWGEIKEKVGEFIVTSDVAQYSINKLTIALSEDEDVAKAAEIAHREYAVSVSSTATSLGDMQQDMEEFNLDFERHLFILRTARALTEQWNAEIRKNELPPITAGMRLFREATEGVGAELADAKNQVASLGAEFRGNLTIAINSGVYSTKELAEKFTISERAVELYKTQLKDTADAHKTFAEQAKKTAEAENKVAEAFRATQNQVGEAEMEAIGKAMQAEEDFATRQRALLNEIGVAQMDAIAARLAGEEKFAEEQRALLNEIGVAQMEAAAKGYQQWEAPLTRTEQMNKSLGNVEAVLGNIQTGWAQMAVVASRAIENISTRLAQGDWVGAIIAGIAACVGFVAGLFGISKAEKEARAATDKTTEAIEKQATAAQRAEAAQSGWADTGALTLIVVRDAYIAAGKSAEEAMADVEAMWDTSEKGAAESAEAIKRVTAVVEEYGSAAKTAQEIAAGAAEEAGYRTRAELEETAKKAQATFEYMRDSGLYTSAEIERAWKDATDAQDAAYGNATQSITDLNNQYKSLADSIKDEAPEKVMGVIETQTRAQMALLKKQSEEQAAQMKKDGESAASSLEKTLEGLDIKPVRVPIEWVVPKLPGGGGGGGGEPTYPGAASGGLFSRPTIRVIAEQKPEIVGEPGELVNTFLTALRQYGSAPSNAAESGVDMSFIKDLTTQVARMRTDLRRLGPDIGMYVRDGVLAAGTR